MKKITLAAAFSIAASTAFAGNLSAPIIADPIIIEDEAVAGSSSSGVLVPLLILAVVAAAVAS